MNRADFVGLYDTQYPRVFLYLLLRLWSRDAAEEITVKVFAVALTALVKGTEPMQVGSWLIGIADQLIRRRVSISLKIKMETFDHAGPKVAVGMAIR
jgi:DNA-directed RNA polymerase specialized sigma24 family protein